MFHLYFDAYLFMASDGARHHCPAAKKKRCLHLSVSLTNRIYIFKDAYVSEA